MIIGNLKFNAYFEVFYPLKGLKTIIFKTTNTSQHVEFFHSLILLTFLVLPYYNPPGHSEGILEISHCYRPQMKFAKVMFLHLAVSHSVRGGGGVVCCPSACWDTHGTRGRHPGADTPLHSACWEIRATSGRYTSYWNAYLFWGFWHILTFFNRK